MTTAVATPVQSSTRSLLTAGILAGPLFVAAVVIQELTRAGFDPKRHPLSLLSLGDQGWIQITNFVVSGVLAFAGAVGLRRVLRGERAGTWGPILFGAYGIALVWGGVFVADPYQGFPVGTTGDQLSWHGVLHAIAPSVAGIGLIAACFVFARRFSARRERAWVAYSIGTAVADIVLTVTSYAASDFRIMLAGGALVWLWASAVTAHVARSA